MSLIAYHEDSAGITSVPGFKSGSTHCDIRNTGDSRLDLTLILSEKPCQAAGVFTRNDLQAAPVAYCKQLIKKGNTIHGIVANSGNANAATGKHGMDDTCEMARHAEGIAQSPASSFLVCSTGRIGRHLPMDNIRAGIIAAHQAIGNTDKHGLDSATAILTSDTRTKSISAAIKCDDKVTTIGAIAKGAGMIEPNMATMLAFITTDIEAPQSYLQSALCKAVDNSFNAITVDGDMSTNDSVLLLANGDSSLKIDDGSDYAELFQEALNTICKFLSKKIMLDGERITKCVELQISGAQNRSDAERVARAIGNSLLVKTSWYGNDPNWGRIACAAGYAGAGLIESKLDIAYDNITALKNGQAQEENIVACTEIASRPEFKVSVNLNIGEGSFNLLASDLTEGYVDFNKSE